MSHSLLQVINPVVSLSINVLAQVIGFRYIKKLSLLKSIVAGFGAGLICVVLLDYYVFSAGAISAADFFAIVITNLIAYSMLGFCYFTFVNLGETARRIRIIRELYDSGEGLTMEGLLKRYNARKMMEMRIGRLVNNGQIIYKDGRYYLGKPLMLIFARIIVMLKLIVLGKRSEFD